jgi:hypothetical protein
MRTVQRDPAFSFAGPSVVGRVALLGAAPGWRWSPQALRSGCGGRGARSVCCSSRAGSRGSCSSGTARGSGHRLRSRRDSCSMRAARRSWDMRCSPFPVAGCLHANRQHLRARRHYCHAEPVWPARASDRAPARAPAAVPRLPSARRPQPAQAARGPHGSQLLPRCGIHPRWLRRSGAVLRQRYAPRRPARGVSLPPPPARLRRPRSRRGIVGAATRGRARGPACRPDRARTPSQSASPAPRPAAAASEPRCRAGRPRSARSPSGSCPSARPAAPG